MAILLSFCGGAGTVTGSCFWLRTPDCQFLVDCGMFQGSKTLKGLNYGRFPFDPAALDFVLLTHAHIDHSGLLPKLHRQGFAGPVFATGPTRDLLGFMLPDSGNIQELEVERLNRRNARRGLPEVEPIYRQADAEACLAAFRAVAYERWFEAGSGVRARFWNAGHILGSASIEIELATGERDGRLLRMLFSGDIGPDNKLFHPDPKAPDNLDYLLCEATYGGRRRPRVTTEQRRAMLAGEVRAALGRGGNLLIPAFAVERTQELLGDLVQLFDAGALPKAPVFLDSPLAIRASETFARHAGALDDLAAAGEPFRRPNIRFTETIDQSVAISRFKGGAIIIAGSGMCEAGRVRHHLESHLWRADSTVLLTGFQAVGTLGRLLAEGARAVRIQGEDLRVNATVRQIDVYSGHADGDELRDWIDARLPVKRAVFLTHGETEALAALRAAAVEAGLEPDRVIVPQLDDSFDLLAARPDAMARGLPHRLPPEAVAGADWHNDLAAFTLDLRAALDGIADDRRRRALLRRLRGLLEAE